MSTVKNGLLPQYAGTTCPYCNGTMDATFWRQPTREHVIPKYRGGPDRFADLVCDLLGVPA